MAVDTAGIRDYPQGSPRLAMLCKMNCRDIITNIPSKARGLQKTEERGRSSQEKQGVNDRIQSGKLTCFCVRLLPSTLVLLLNQSSLTLIDRGDNNPSKTR